MKIVGNVKIGPYADEWHPDTLIPPDNVKESGDRNSTFMRHRVCQEV